MVNPILTVAALGFVVSLAVGNLLGESELAVPLGAATGLPLG